MRVNQLHKRENKLDKRIDGAKESVNDIHSSCNQEKAKIKYLYGHLELARSTRTIQLQEKINEAKLISSELGIEFQSLDNSPSNPAVSAAHRETLKNLHAKLVEIEKETTVRKQEIDNKAEITLKMYTEIGVTNLESALKEYERIIVINNSLSQRTDALLEEIKKLQTLKHLLNSEKRELLAIAVNGDENTLARKLEVIQENIFSEHQQVFFNSRSQKDNFNKQSNFLKKVLDSISMVVQKLDKSDQNQILGENYTSGRSSFMATKDYEVEVTNLLAHLQNKIKQAETLIVHHHNKAKLTRFYQSTVSIEDNHPFPALNTNKKSKLRDTLKISQNNMHKHVRHFLRDDLMRKHSKIIDMILGAEEIERNARNSVNVSPNERSNSPLDSKIIDFDAEIDSPIKYEDPNSSKSGNNRKLYREVDEITGINNIDRKLQIFTAKAHQYRKILNKNESLRFLSLDLAQKKIKLIKNRGISSMIVTPKKNIELPPLQKESRMASSSSAKTVPSTPSKRSPVSMRGMINMPDYISRIKSVYNL